MTYGKAPIPTGTRVRVRPYNRASSIMVPQDEPGHAWRQEALPEGTFDGTVRCLLPRGAIVQTDEAFLGTTLTAFGREVQDAAAKAGVTDQDGWFLIVLDREMEALP